MDNEYIEATPIILEEQSLEVLQKTVRDVDAVLAVGGPNVELFHDILTGHRNRCVELIKQRSA
jgi:hypothetical protein